jgi:uncharacterized membrane protein YccC
MGKRGPAPYADDQRRTRRVSVYLTPAEYERLADNAAGRSVSDVLRRAGLGRSLEAPPQVPAVNREAWQSLARVVGNLNQLAHHANRGERVGPELADELAEVRAQVAQLRKELVGDEGQDHQG